MRRPVGKICAIVTVFLILSTINMAFPGKARGETAYITLGESGWSDPSVGTFDSLTKTGVLSQDIYGTIEIVSDGITLDGAEHTITGDGSNNGVYSESNHHLTIKNLYISGCRNGILLSWSHFNTVTGNVITDSQNANLYLSRSEHNEVTGNRMANSNYSGLLMREFANDNTIQDNALSGNTIGVSLFGAQRNLFLHNDIEHSTSVGMLLNDFLTPSYNIPSSQNQVYQNNFVNNSTHAYVYNHTLNADNRFFRNLPEGGNYWSGHTSSDTNSDGIADAPFVFTGGQDNLPWMTPSGWESGEPPATPDYLYVYLTNEGWSEPVGTWDQAVRTATMTQDITGTICIMVNSVTLEGGGHTVLGDGNGIGVQIASHGYIIVRDLHVGNHHYGFYLSYAYDSCLENCVSSDSEYGFYLFESRRNSLLDNASLDNARGIVLSTLSDDNMVRGNLMKGSECGLDLPGSFDNVIIENTVRDSSVSGVSIRLQPYTGTSVLHANRNEIYNNDFINNATQASVYAEGTDNIFNLESPVGGNYWDSHISVDANLDGFADSPFVFSGGQDNLPLMAAFGWHPGEEPPANEYVAAVSSILEAFDEAVAGGTLEGNGNANKLIAFRDKLTEVREKLAADEMRAAYQLLRTIYNFIDGEGSPKDLVVGTSAGEIAAMIAQLLESIAP